MRRKIDDVDHVSHGRRATGRDKISLWGDRPQQLRLKAQNPSMSSSLVEFASIVKSERDALEDARIADLIYPGAAFSHTLL